MIIIEKKSRLAIKKTIDGHSIYINECLPPINLQKRRKQNNWSDYYQKNCSVKVFTKRGDKFSSFVINYLKAAADIQHIAIERHQPNNRDILYTTGGKKSPSELEAFAKAFVLEAFAKVNPKKLLK